MHDGCAAAKPTRKSNCGVPCAPAGLLDSSFVASIHSADIIWISIVPWRGFPLSWTVFQHGHPQRTREDEVRRYFLAGQGIEELRFWNHQWRKNPDGVLLEIWRAVHGRTGCIELARKVENRRFVPPRPDFLKGDSL
jgi:hypothetical protein